MHLVERRLVVGERVDRRHVATFDAAQVVEDLGDRRQAVGRARGVGDDHVFGGQLVVVDAVNDRLVGAVARRRNDDALGAGGQVGGGCVALGEDAGAFKGDVDVQLLVRQLGRVADRRHLDRGIGLAVGFDEDVLAFDLDGRREAAVHAVVTQQVRIGFHRAQVVDRHDFDIRAALLDDRAKDEATDAAEAVDGNA